MMICARLSRCQPARREVRMNRKREIRVIQFYLEGHRDRKMIQLLQCSEKQIYSSSHKFEIILSSLGGS